MSALRFAADEGCVGEALVWIDTQCAVHGLSREISACLAVVSEEVITNIVKYGGPPAPTVEISVAYAEPTVQLVFVDDGVPFDPTAAANIPLGDDIATRGIGGLGLLLIRQMMDDVAYVRLAGHNHLTLRKRVPATSSPSPDRP